MESADSKEVLKQAFIDISCGSLQGKLHMDKFRCPGIHSQCVEYEGQMITPKKFTILGEKQSLKDWKKALRINRMPLREIMDKGYLDFSHHDQTCTGRCLGRSPATPKPLSQMEQKNLNLSVDSPLLMSGPMVGEVMTINEHTYCHLPNDGEAKLSDDDEDPLQGTIQKRPVVYVVGNAAADAQMSEKILATVKTETTTLLAGESGGRGRASLEELVRLADTQDVYSDQPIDDKLEDSQKFWEGIIGLGLLEDFIEEIKLALDIVRSRMLRSRELMLRESKKLSNVVNELGLFRMLQRRMIELQQETNVEQHKVTQEMTELKRKWAETQKRKSNLDKKGRLFQQITASGRLKRDSSSNLSEDRNTGSPLSADMAGTSGNQLTGSTRKRNTFGSSAGTGSPLSTSSGSNQFTGSSRKNKAFSSSAGTQTPIANLPYGETESSNSSSNGSVEFDEPKSKRVKIAMDEKITVERGSSTAKDSCKHANGKNLLDNTGKSQTVRVPPLDNSCHVDEEDEVYTITLATSDDSDGGNDDPDSSNEEKILNERQKELFVDENTCTVTENLSRNEKMEVTGEVSDNESENGRPRGDNEGNDNVDDSEGLSDNESESPRPQTESTRNGDQSSNANMDETRAEPQSDSEQTDDPLLLKTGEVDDTDGAEPQNGSKPDSEESDGEDFKETDKSTSKTDGSSADIQDVEKKSGCGQSESRQTDDQSAMEEAEEMRAPPQCENKAKSKRRK